MNLNNSLMYPSQCLKDTGYHHLELLAFITRISTVLFFPVWLLGDCRRIMNNEEFVSYHRIKICEVFM